MATWRMDRKTAIYIAENFGEMEESFPLEHCPKCGSDYLKEVGHEHDDYIDLQLHDIIDEAEVKPIKIVPPIHNPESDDAWNNIESILINKREN